MALPLPLLTAVWEAGAWVGVGTWTVGLAGCFSVLTSSMSMCCELGLDGIQGISLRKMLEMREGFGLEDFAAAALLFFAVAGDERAAFPLGLESSGLEELSVAEPDPLSFS